MFWAPLCWRESYKYVIRLALSKVDWLNTLGCSTVGSCSGDVWFFMILFLCSSPHSSHNYHVIFHMMLNSIVDKVVCYHVKQESCMDDRFFMQNLVKFSFIKIIYIYCRACSTNGGEEECI
jgi:hypothetical protein